MQMGITVFISLIYDLIVIDHQDKALKSAMTLIVNKPHATQTL